MQVNQENEYLIIVQSESRSEIGKVLPEVSSELLKIIKADSKKVSTLETWTEIISKNENRTSQQRSTCLKRNGRVLEETKQLQRLVIS